MFVEVILHSVLATRVLSGMASVRATLTDALREIGVKP